jgi:hypothetical protein
MIYKDKYGKFHYSGEVDWLSREEKNELALRPYAEEDV